MNTKRVLARIVKKDEEQDTIKKKSQDRIDVLKRIEQLEKEGKLQQKDVKSKEHLEEMAEITRHLSYNDIKLLRKNVDNSKKKNISKEIEQKARKVLGMLKRGIKFDIEK